MSDDTLTIRQNLLWNSVGNFCYLVSQWLITFLTTRIGGYSAAGVLSIAMSLGGTYASVANYSMRHYQASDVDNLYSDAVYVWSRYVTSAASFILCMISVVVLGYDEFTSSCVAIYMLFKITEAISDVYQGGMQKRMRMDYIGKAYLYKALLCLGVYLLAYCMSDDLFLSLLLITVVASLIVFEYERRVFLSFTDYGACVSFHSIARLLTTCLPLMVFGLCLSAVGQAPKLIIEARLGEELLGVYASIATPVTVIQVMANYLFAPLTTPFATYLHEGRMREFWKLFAKVLATLAVIAVVSIVGASFLGPQVLYIMFGESILQYTDAVVPLVACGILTAFVWFFSNVLTVLRKTKVLALLSILSVGISIVASLYLVGNYGINGASYGLMIALGVFVCGAFALLIMDSSLRND